MNTRLRDRRGQLLMSQFLLEAMGCAAMAGGSGADDGSVEDTMEAVDRLRRSYSRTPPDSLKQAIKSRLSLIRRLLGGRLRLGRRRELLDAAGWLTLLLGTVHFDLDEIEPAHAWRRVALLLSREVADRELEAWCWETPAWFAFSEQRYRDAVELAHRGLSLSPASSVQVALHLQQARAWARLGDASATLPAIRKAAHALEGLTTPEHLDDHYVFDPAKSDLFVADCYTLLGQAKPAEHHARQFIAQAALAGSRDYWPIRIASSRMDLGFALLHQHRIDEAAAEAAQGLDVFILNRGTLRRASELDRALAAFGEVPEVRDFHERLEKAWRQLTAC